MRDLNGRLLAWNQGAVRLYGWSEAEALQMNIRSIVPEQRENAEIVRLQQLSLSEILEPYCTQRVTKNGTLVPVLVFR